MLPGDPPPRVVGFLEAVRRWASARPDILAVALVGSYARGAATDSSDVDLVLLTEEPESYFVDTAWVGVFGDFRCQQAEDWGKVTSLRVWYQDGLEVEYGFARPEWPALPLDDGTRSVIQAGMVALCDPKGLLSRIREP